MIPVAMVAGLLAFWVLLSVKVLKEYECGVIFRLGKVLPRPKGPGLVLVAWPIDRMVRVDLRRAALSVPPPELILRDNIAVTVNMVVYFRPVHSSKAVVQGDD